MRLMMTNIYSELFKQDISDRSLDITLERLKKVSSCYQTGISTWVITFIRIPVRIAIYREALEVSLSKYNVYIEAKDFDNRSPYYNGECASTMMTLDRVLFYLRYYLEAI